MTVVDKIQAGDNFFSADFHKHNFCVFVVVVLVASLFGTWSFILPPFSHCA